MTLRQSRDERMELARAAESHAGVAFRLHGRDPRIGLDCVGLVLAAMADIGRVVRLPLRYSLRNSDLERFRHLPALAGFTGASTPFRAGDVLLLEPGPAQLHLAVVASEGGIVHAHASLGRVVHTPFPLCWPVAGQWRLALSAPE
jgi:cell wall-associated NlpC family hydrolase